jgi:hypothetical protein
MKEIRINIGGDNLFFKRKKNETIAKKNAETKEDVFIGRTMVFKLKDGTWMFDMTKGFLNKIETERDSIDAARKMYQENYAGTYDLYKFKIQNGEILDILTNFSYEDIWKMWTDRGGKVGKDGYVAWGLKFKENDEEWNKQVMITSMLLEFKSDKTMGTGNSELDKHLNHDLVLCSIGRLESAVKKNSKKKMDALLKIKSQIEYYKLPENDEDKFKKIIDSI